MRGGGLNPPPGPGGQARCVIITSGTLSPMDSFEGELGVKFDLKLEAPHIIPEKQLFV